jgi:hypothetical protein
MTRHSAWLAIRRADPVLAAMFRAKLLPRSRIPAGLRRPADTGGR